MTSRCSDTSLADTKAYRGKTLLLISKGRGLRRVLSVPRAARQEIRQLLSHQIERLTPYTKDEVRFGYRILDQASGGPELAVELTVIPEAEVERGQSLSRHLALEPEMLCLERTEDHSVLSPDLFGRKEAGSRPAIVKWATIALATANAAMLFLLLAAPILSDAKAVTELRALVATETLEAQVVGRLRERIAVLEAEALFLPGQREAVPLKLPIIERLTTAIPDDAWLDALTITNERARLSGSARSTSAVLKGLEASSVFSDVRYAAPVRRDATRDLEKFVLSVGLVRGSER